MNELSNRLNRLSPSATLAMSQKSGELKAQGIDIINMSVGEPDFNTPDHIKAAAIKAVEENWSRYSPVAGSVSYTHLEGPGFESQRGHKKERGFYIAVESSFLFVFVVMVPLRIVGSLVVCRWPLPRAA